MSNGATTRALDRDEDLDPSVGYRRSPPSAQQADGAGVNDTTHDDWDPRAASVQERQRRAYDDMRERCPVAHSEFLGWSLFRHQDVVNVLADPTTYSSASRHSAIPNGMDPPDHSRYRDALAPYFSADRMAALEPRCREIAGDLLAPMLADGDSEFTDAFATPFPLKVLCAFLGWPSELWECLGGWTHGNQEAAFTRDRAAGKALASLFSEHVKANLTAHRASRQPTDDVTARLLATSVESRPLDDVQIVSILRNWTAGHGTVSAGLSILVLHLAKQQELQQRLRAEPSLIPAALEEILRSDDPLVANRRTTTGEVEIGGRTIPAGSNLTLMWIAANRDPRAFENPDSTERSRGMDASLVWCRGIHLCLGALLARLELRVALDELLKRTRRFEVAGDAPRRTSYPSNGLVSLQLRFG
jgi:cytochrome P450